MFAKKSLGQNFLHSKKILREIVRAGNVVPGETVLEAGPGTGNLTEALLTAGARVMAVEKDHRLIPVFQKKFSSEIASGKLQIVHADILDFSPSLYKLQTNRYKLIANIPYYITGGVLRKFLSSENQPSMMALMLQKEVAERIVAKNGKESLLSISVKAFGSPRYIKTVKAGNFYPAPAVDSAIMAVENISKKNFADCSEENFFEIVKAGFAHKRKIISNNLKPVFGNKTEEKIIKCKIIPTSRAEGLTLEKWLCLATD